MDSGQHMSTAKHTAFGAMKRPQVCPGGNVLHRVRKARGDGIQDYAFREAVQRACDRVATRGVRPRP
jgi:hypothetical protein